MNVIIDKWFANPVWEIALDLDTSELISYCYNLKEQNPGVNKSNKGGWHSPNLFGNEMNNLVAPPNVYLKLLDQINEALIIVHESMGLKISTPSYATESWIMINQPNSYNLRHLHPRSVFSGVYYLQVPEGDCGDIILYRENTMLSYLPPHIVEDWNDMTGGTATYKAKQGTLLIFPSWVEHSVTPNFTQQDRISISFNTNYNF
jgi:uncharacterized protein (TIGR02466 family)